MSYYDKDRDDVAHRIGRYPGPGLNSAAEYQQAGRPFLQKVTPGETHDNGAAGTEAFDDNNLVKNDVVSIEFPFITKRITLRNLDDTNDAYVYFTSLMVPAEDLGDDDKAGDAAAAEDRTVLDPGPTKRGNALTTAELNAYNNVADARPDSAVKVNGHYYTLEPGETIDMNLKCKRVYIAGNGDVRVYAELTNIVHPYNLDLRGIEGISGGTSGTVKS